jgi:hypothetical protein
MKSNLLRETHVVMMGIFDLIFENTFIILNLTVPIPLTVFSTP